MNELNNRIKEIVKYSGLNKKKFSEHIGVAASTVGDILRDKKGAGKAVIEKIINCFPQINTLWLISGSGEMLLKKEESSIKKPFSEFVTTAPLISQYAHAGYLSGYADTEYIEQQPVYVASKKFSNGNYVAFEIRGDSMEDGQRHAIYNSDIVLGRELIRDYWKCKIHYPKAFVIVHRSKGIICKEIIGHEVEKGIITCHSFNPEYADFELELKDIVQLFYIKEIKREP